jgi:hypothetical protein
MVNVVELAFCEVRADPRAVASCSSSVERLARPEARRVGSEVPKEMVSPEALKLNKILRNAPKAVDMDLPHQREAGEGARDHAFGDARGGGAGVGRVLSSRFKPKYVSSFP